MRGKLEKLGAGALIVCLCLLLIPISGCGKKKISATGPGRMSGQDGSGMGGARTGDERLGQLKEDALGEGGSSLGGQLEGAGAEAGTAESFTQEDVLFDYDSYALTAEGQDILTQKAAFLQGNSDANIIIEGHCDERGTVEYNLALGERRAESAKTFLVNKGVSASRIITISYGEERPVDRGHSEEAWYKNRRAHFVIQ